MKTWIVPFGAIVILAIAASVFRAGPDWFGQDRISDSQTVVQSIERLGQLQTSRHTIQEVITAESNTGGVFSFLVGQRLLLVASGYVVAGVDLTEIDAETDILIEDVEGGKRIDLTIPPVRLLECGLYENDTYVFDYERALFAGEYTLETDARRAAVEHIRDTALESEILENARQQAEYILEALLYGLQFTEVTVHSQEMTPLETSRSCYGS